MRIISFVFILYFITLVGRDISTAQCWVYQNSGTSSTLYGISFADSHNGIIVGSRTILRTTDGGSTWINLPYSSSYPSVLSDVCMLDSNTAIAIGSSGSVLKTSDGGNSWQVLKKYYIYLSGISFVDSSNGFIVGYEGTILRTTDAGQTWNKCSSGTVVSLVDVAYIDIMHAIAVGDSGIILSTSDNGMTWTYNYLPVSKLNGISFSDTLIGTIVGVDGFIYRTTDGGVNWDQQMVNPTVGTLFDVSFFDPNHGVAVEWNHMITTYDGGINWIVHESYCDQYRGCWGTVLIDSIHGFAIGTSGTIIGTLKEDCDSTVKLLYPLNGMENLPLEQSSENLRSCVLEWNFEKSLNIDKSIVQISVDSLFAEGKINEVDVYCYTETLRVKNLLPGTTYYWRVKLSYYGMDDANWSTRWKFTTAAGFISGKVFEDIDQNGKYDEPLDKYLSDWPLLVSGKINNIVYTDYNGQYTLAGIDSGTYIINDRYKQEWRRTFPDTNLYVVNLNINEMVTGLDFGRCFPWNTISGDVFHDRNENGVRDQTEKGLKHWSVRLSGRTNDWATTDTIGNYKFWRVETGTNFVSVPWSSWESIYPNNPPEYEIIFSAYDEDYNNINFAVHPIPNRLKLNISVEDCTKMSQTIRWGVRPGATYGIWSVDRRASNIDFAEGENEIPPQFYGIFDARFVDSRKTSEHFGCGSYTDMRDFISTDQIDTHRVSFMPGYLWGGDYPMTLRWSMENVQNAYNGAVTFIDQLNNRTDLKTIDTLVITNPDTRSLLLISQEPKLSENYLRQWRMVSIPVEMEDNRPEVIFKPIGSRAYTYIPNLGYYKQDTLLTGVGYWLKGAMFSDATLMTGVPRLHDTIAIEQGWNLIGSLSEPISIENIETIPADLVSSFIFGFDSLYFVVDSMKPFNAYWLKSKSNGELIMSAGSMSRVNSASKINTHQIIEKANILSFYDASGDIRKLYFNLHENGEYDPAQFDFPPQTPDEMFDVRFQSNRMLEAVERGKIKEFSIDLKSVTYPLTIRWELKSADVTASLKIDKQEIFLRTNGVSVIQVPSKHMILNLKGESNIPQEYSLMQNYPNPFNSGTTFKYDLPVASKVIFKIYNLLGQEIETLIDGVQDAGYKTVEWNSDNRASGLYFYRIEAKSVNGFVKSFSQVRKMLLIK